MSDKERLEAIKEEYEWNVSQENALPVAHSDIEWLMQQAKRAIKSEEELDRWTTGRNVAVSTYEKIRELNEENVRLREALEYYAYQQDYADGEIAQEALGGHVDA